MLKEDLKIFLLDDPSKSMNVICWFGVFLFVYVIYDMCVFPLA